jgi:hypothetical protein
MHKSAMKCNETVGKWCKNKHGASKIIDTFETYQLAAPTVFAASSATTKDGHIFLPSVVRQTRRSIDVGEHWRHLSMP